MSREHGTLMDRLVPLLAASSVPERREGFDRLPKLARAADALRADRVRRGLPAPSTLFVSVTTRCPFTCSHCSSAAYPAGVDLPTWRMERLLREATDLGIFFVGVTGGEPLLHPDLLEVLARHDRCLYLLFTSGAAVDERAAVRLARMPHVLPFLGVEGGAEVNDRLRGKGATQASQEAMTLLERYGVPFGFSATARSENLGELLGTEFYLDLASRGVRFGIVLEALPVGRAEATCRPLGTQERQALARHLGVLRGETGAFLALLPWDERSEGGCQAGTDLLHVNALGQVEPCPFLRVAPSASALPLEEALGSDLFRALRAAAGTPDSSCRVPCWFLENRGLLDGIVDVCGARRTVGCAGQETRSA
ncbi:MAG: radical SAM protein [Planctomycetota bacterium]